MAFERISDNLEELKGNIRAFAQSSAEYYKLDLFDKTMKGATAAVKSVAIAFFLVFTLLFFSIALAVLLGNWMESPSGGFFLVCGIYLLISLWLIFFGGPVINRVMLSKASQKVFKEPEEEPKKEHPEFSSEAVYTNEEIIIEEDERI